MLMVGDFVIALSTYPVQLAVQWWKTRFTWFLEPSTSEDSAEESPNEDSTSEVSSSFFASGRHPIPPARGGELRSLRKSSKEIPYENRPPYISPGMHRERVFSQEDLPQEPNMWVSGPSVKRPSSSRQSSRSQTLPTADNDNGEIDSSRHQIWYPPSASYPDNGIDAAEVDRTLRPLVSVRVREQVTVLAEQQTDEWRQYPPFPSAYPPTPIATTARLVPTSLGLSPSLYPPILEEMNQQNFHRSPLPPRVPLNPSRAGDLGDYHNHSGIPTFLTSDADDSISTDGYGNEDEDDFNATLKTPLQLNGSIRSRVRPRLFVSPPPISAVSSNLSVPSRSSALTTMDNGSPFRTDAWSDSSHSSTVFNRLPASVIGKKRSHPRALKDNSGRVEEDLDYESSDVHHPSSSSHEKRSTTSYSQSHALERLESVSTSDAADSVDIAHSTSSSEYREQSPPKEKRRKVTKSLPTRTVNSRPIKNKTSKISPPPRLRAHTPVNSRQTKRSRGSQLLEVPAPPAKRRSERLKGGGSVEMEGKGRDQNNGVDTERLTESSMQESATRMRKKDSGEAL